MPVMPIRAYSLLILTTLIWAGNSVAGKISVGHIHPVLLTALRWTLALVVILAVSVKPLKRDWPVIRKHWPLLLAYGATGFGLFNMILYTALNHTSVINVMIEQASIPIVIFLGNFLLFGTRAKPAQLIGFGLTLVGVLLTATQGDLSRLLGLQLNIGDGLMLLAVLIYGGYTVALKWKPPVHWQSLLAIPCIGAVLACLPFLAWHYREAAFVLPDAVGWSVVVYAGLMASLIASATYIKGIELIGPNRAGLFINLIPIFGVALSVMILRAPLHGFHFVALILVSAGIVLSEWGRGRIVAPQSPS